MKTHHSCLFVARFLAGLAFLLAACLPVFAQEGRQYPLGPIGGYFSVSGGTSLAIVRSVDAGGAGATAGLQAGDFIYGAFGQVFTPTGGDHYGVTQELGFAVDRAEAADGILPLLVMRPGTGALTINVALAASGAFGPAYPRNSAKYAPMYEAAVADLHTRIMNSGNGYMGYPTGFAGLCLLGHPNWNDTTGAKPYRLSINKIRDLAIQQITNWGYAPTESALVDGSPISNPVGGPSNWELGQYMMFLSEYYAKTSDSSVFASLQRGAEMCANTVQWWKQPVNGGLSPEYAQVAGMSGHGGVTGDYMHQGWYCGINATGVHNMNGLAFARRAGANMDVRPKDGHYYGFTTLNPGDPIPSSIINALPSSITLPQYAADPVRGLTIANSTSNPVNRSDASDPFWYNPSLAQKFLMQMNFICRRSLSNGSVRYAPETGDDADSLRTTGALLGMSLYQADVGGLDSADLGRLESMKQRITANYMAQQTSHVVCLFSGQAFQSFCAPFLSDRQQRFSLDNWRFYYALSRTANNGYRYFQARGGEDAGAYQDNNLCASINMALPYGIANGGYSLIPAYNTNRSIANFKAPFLMWPSIAARTATITTSSQAFQVDVCDGNGNVLAPASYTATWSHVSGPATATFSPSNAANTTITLPTVSATAYRVRLTISRSGVPDLVEDLDLTRANTTTPVAPSISQQPVAVAAPPGGNASFSVTMAGTGPFVYQWRLDGVAYWPASTSPTLSLTNVSGGAAGLYDCVITTPTGTITSNSAALTISATLARLTGGLRREIWTPSYGAAVSDLTSNLSFPRFPAITSSVTSAEAQNYGDNYGEKLSGWIKPPVSGNYRFYMSSDDGAELWLSTDATTANKVKIINHPNPVGLRVYDLSSANIPLVAGQKYYLEIIHKEAGGGDHVSVAWQIPGEPAPTSGSAPIDGVYLEYDAYLPLLTNQWTLNEPSGSTAADSIGTATATLFNNPGHVAGISGNALSFNGTNQYAQATVNVSETVYGVSLWFRTTQASGGLFSVVDGASSFDRCLFLNGGNISSYIWSGETIISSGQNYADGNWHHVVHTFGGSMGGQKLYVDGVQVASGGKANSDFNWQTAIRIGHAPNSTYFNGQIDDVRVYNAALASSDAAAIYRDVINVPPQMSAHTFSIAENASVGATVGTVVATDASPGQTLAYTIIGGNVGNRFALNSSSGLLTLAATVDYEASTARVLTVTATDNGNPSQSVTASVTVNVTNVNEPPVWASNPIVGTPAAPGLAYSSSISAQDPEATTVTYLKMGGPAWLSVASNGALSGTPSSGDIGINSFTVRATDANSLTADVTLQIEVIDVAVSPVWINTAGGSWPVSGNWLSGGVANGQAATANFASLDLAANATVTLDGARALGGLNFGDTTPSHDWTLNPGSGGALTLTVASGSPIINVANQNTNIGLVLAGNQGLIKTGAGTLTLGAVNTLTGSHVIRQGTLAVTRQNAITATTLSLGDSGTGVNATGLRIDPGTTGTMNLSSVTTSSFGTGHTITFNSGGSLGANVSALNATLNLVGNVPLTLRALNTGGHSTAQDWTGRIIGTGIGAGTTSLVLNGATYPLRLSFGNSTNPNTFTGDVLIQGNVTTQNQTYSGNTAGNQNNGFTLNNITVAASSTWTLVWGGETIGGLNGSGNVSLNCQSALNNVGLTIGNTNADGSFTGAIGGGFGVTKIGAGTQALGGANSYSGPTNITAGKLQVNGSLAATSAVTVGTGATLSGSGTVNGTVTLSTGATIAPGTTSIGTLTVANTVTLHDSGTIAMRLNKTGGAVSADRLALAGTTGLTFKGTLDITMAPNSEPLAAGDTFQLFSKTAGTFTGSFAAINLPTLPQPLLWNTDNLATGGTIAVAIPPTVATPAFSPVGGNYLGTQSVTISTTTAGATIKYTTDGSNPANSGTAISGTTPITGITVPSPATMTIRAYALNSGMLDSAEASATYNTVNGGSWSNLAGGSWGTTANWANGMVPNGSGFTADFSTLDLTANATLTLDGPRTIGILKFGDTNASHDWTLNTGTGGPLTLAVSSGTPEIFVLNRTATINAVLAGNQGFVKTGAGTLTLAGANTFTGNITVSRGLLDANHVNALGAPTNTLVLGDANTGSNAVELKMDYGISSTATLATISTSNFGTTQTITLNSGSALGANAPVLTATINLSGSVPLTIAGTNTAGHSTAQDINCRYIGTGIPAGTTALILDGTIASVRTSQVGNTSPASNFTGDVLIKGFVSTQGRTYFGNNAVDQNLNFLNNDITLSSGATWRIVWGGETAGALNGPGNIDLSNQSALNNVGLTFGNNNRSGNYSGVISGGFGIAKVGTGTQTLAGAHTYGGTTAINAGTLLVTGSLPNTTTTVAAAGTLGGTGTVSGATTVNGTLAPGSGGIGTLTVNNTLTLAGTTAMEISNAGGTLTSDRVSGVSLLTHGGTLAVTNAGPDPLAAGNSFTLFSASTRSGSFATVTLPTLGSGLAWDTAQLHVNGTISIVATLPPGWTGADIGAVGVAGSSSGSGSSFTVSGSGADIWAAADNFQFLSQTLVGNGEIRARVTSQTNPSFEPKAGVMIRDGSGAGAVNAMMTVAPAGFHFQYRATASGSSNVTSGPALNPAPNNWIRLVRSGNLFTGYRSADGVTWTQVGATTITMGSSVSIGLAVCSKNNSGLSTAAFDNVSITPFPAPWLTADIGTTGLQGSAEYFGNTYTVKGAGTFGGTTDGFRYVYQTLTADGSITARVSGLQDTGTNARIGVMIRDTLANNSRMAALSVTGSGAWRWQRRTTVGGTVSTTNSSSGIAPNLWVRLTRSGNTITAYRSTNGTSWITISSVTVTMASNCYIGLGVASGSTTTLNTSVMDNVTVVP